MARAVMFATAGLAFAVGARAEPTVPALETTSKLERDALAAAARAAGLLISVLGPRTARLVTHLDVTDEQIDNAATILDTALRA